MKTTILGPIKRYLSAGVSASLSPDANRKIYVTNLFGLVGYSITLILSIRAAIVGDFWLSLSLLAAAALFYGCRLYQRYSSSPRRHDTSGNILLSCLVMLMIYLVHSGGNNNTGPLWAYLVPPVAMFLAGFRAGLFINGIFLATIAFIMFAPIDGLLQADYSYEFKSRLLYSYMTLTFLAGFYEYSRQQSFAFVQQLSDQFERQARHDPLTGLPNRRGMRSTLEYEWARSQRSGQPMSVVLVDIDRFKQINDSFGHDAGDTVLVELAKLFRAHIRQQDVVGRWGGEEFLFVLPETNLKDACVLAEKLREFIQESPVPLPEQQLKVTFSAGISVIDDELSIDQAISLADKRLYRAKQDGRNRVCID